MDKLKAQLAPVLQQWFWITTALVLFGSLGIWWMASGRLISEFESARNKIESDAKSVTAVSAKLNEHPNPKTQEEMEKLIKARKKSVLDAWTNVYERQRAILVWPVKELQEDFVREFRDLVPIEEKVQFPTAEEDEKETSLLNRYSYYIGTVLPGIAEIGRTKWTADFEKAASASSMDSTGGMDDRTMGTGATISTDDGPLVKWNTGSQEALMKDLFPWKIAGQPKTLDVLYSQENLWILRQLMQIIADVNGDVGQRFQAKIHEINQIAIGSSVKTSAGVISKPSMEGNAAGMGMMGDSSMSSSMGMGMDSSSMGMGMGMGMDGTMGGTDPGDNRYIDKTGKPLTAAQLRGALASSSPEDASIAVAKRVPVMLSLKMDQRTVPDLIAKCGSAALMVEVRQVRILPKGASASDSMSSGGSGESMGSGMGMGSGTESQMGMTAASNVVGDPFPFDLDVEIYGVINIYNPPFEEKLGVEKVTEETVVDGTAMVDGRKVDVPTSPAVAEPAVVTPAPEPVAPVTPAPDATAAPVTPAPDATAPPVTPAPDAAVPPAAVPPAAVPPAAVPPAAVPPAAVPATPEPGVVTPPENLPAPENVVPPAVPPATGA